MPAGNRENRKFPRFTISLEVEVYDTKQDPHTLTTRDISDGGVFLRTTQDMAPLVGSELVIKLKEQIGGEEPLPVKVRVVRVVEDGMALEFIEP